MFWMAVALAGGADKANAKLVAALEACGTDEVCRATATEKAFDKAQKKDWQLPAIEAEEVRLFEIAMEQLRVAGEEALQEAIAVGNQEPIDTEAALMALANWKAEHPDHPAVERLPRLMQELFDRITFRPEPSWKAEVVQPVDVSAESYSLVQRSEKKNQVTDDEAWFENNGLEMPAHYPGGFGGGSRPAPSYNLGSLGEPEMITLDGDVPVGIWSRGLQAVVISPTGVPTRIFDFRSHQRSPKTLAGDEMFVEQELTWATVRDGVLYVSIGHRTYAKSSYGDNAYLRAYDVETGELLWCSAPLVSNSRNFVVLPSQILTGYGFTAEPDFVFLLDRSTGATKKKIKVRSGPDYLIRKDAELHVRTYDRDLVFELE